MNSLPGLLTLAQGGSGVDLGPLLIWVGIGVGVVIIAGMVIMAIRRQALDRNSLADNGTMFDQIRSLRDQGEISTEEFNAIRATLIAKTKASLEEKDQEITLPKTQPTSRTKSQSDSQTENLTKRKTPTPPKSDGTEDLDHTGDKGF